MREGAAEDEFGVTESVARSQVRGCFGRFRKLRLAAPCVRRYTRCVFRPTLAQVDDVSLSIACDVRGPLYSPLPLRKSLRSHWAK